MVLYARLRTAAPAAAVHFGICLAIATAGALLVFGYWFPHPYRELCGGTELFWLVVGVDVVCGPLLTLVLFDRNKSRSELARDMSLVAAIQIAALAFGIHSVFEARPAALVFEVDRFRAVSFADVENPEVATKRISELANSSRERIPVLGLREPRDANEQLESVQLSLSGIELSQLPDWWEPYANSRDRILQNAHAIEALRLKGHGATAALDKAIRESGAGEAALRWLPVVSRTSTDWIVLLDAKTADARKFVHINGL